MVNAVDLARILIQTNDRFVLLKSSLTIQLKCAEIERHLKLLVGINIAQAANTAQRALRHLNRLVCMTVTQRVSKVQRVPRHLSALVCMTIITSC